MIEKSCILSFSCITSKSKMISLVSFRIYVITMFCKYFFDCYLLNKVSWTIDQIWSFKINGRRLACFRCSLFDMNNDTIEFKIYKSESFVNIALQNIYCCDIMLQYTYCSETFHNTVIGLSWSSNIACGVIICLSLLELQKVD